MDYLTAEASRAWAAGHGLQLDESPGHPLGSEARVRLSFRIPADAGARVALARTLWERAVQGAPEVLVWVTGWGVWPSGEHRPLAEAVRRGFGAGGELAESPGHLVGPGEDDAGLSILCLALLFLWDCWVLPAGGRRAVFVSHDELGFVDAHGEDRIVLDRLRETGALSTC